MYKKVTGTKDILPEEAVIWQNIENACRKIFRLYNYCEIRTPLIEDASLFNRSLGESAEIVQKQMFIFQNKDELYALRPEGTASIVRAYIENNIDKSSLFSKFYYMGPMFRFERPQKGRLRQFSHIGCEAIGSCDPRLDTEVISLASGILNEIGINDAKIRINSLGCSKDKDKLSMDLREKLEANSESLCEDCKKRLQTNVLRILDCKTESCKKIIANLESGHSHLCEDCKAHFEEVKRGLNLLGIKYELDNTLVRGLDYYTQTVFEISHENLGSQDAIGAGGRYNNLVKELGGPDLGATGFAFGAERIIIASQKSKEAENSDLIFIITLGEEAEIKGLETLNLLRRNGIRADMDYEGKSVKGAMRRAGDLNSKYALIIGENELKKGVFTLKNMQTGGQSEITAQNLIKELKC